ncbi:DUF6129 family protein [Xanthobacter sp. V4C-4]|uniref:DUF6129 family protein n=1 Tax=Xanthobacter cornucopiae TaxID=3119924 RepID=UPI00372AA02F
MAVSDTDLSEIEKVLATEDLATPAFAVLRQRFPQLSWTKCDASDVTEPPFRTVAAYDIHLLDTADHCVQLTTDLARATGIVLAKRSDV